jgi:hypothetical protein
MERLRPVKHAKLVFGTGKDHKISHNSGLAHEL